MALKNKKHSAAKKKLLNNSVNISNSHGTFTNKAHKDNTLLLASHIAKLQKDLVKQRYISFTGAWNFQAVEAAITGLVTGNFRDISMLARTMQADAAFSAALNKRVQAFLRSEFYVYSEKETAESNALKYFIEKNFEKIFPELQLQRLVKSYLTVGIGLAFIQWEQQDSFWFPKVYALDTENLKYMQPQRKYQYMSFDSIIDIEPSDGNWIIVSQWRPGDLCGFAAELGKLWCSKKFTEQDWMEVNQSHINPFTVINDDGTGVQSEQSDIDNLIMQTQQQKVDRVMYVPPGLSMDIKDAVPGYSSSTFSDFIEYCDRKFQVSILGSNTASEIVDQGSRATAEVHNSIERAFTETDIKVMSSELQEQLIKHFITVNFGEEYLENAPKICWRIPSNEDKSLEIDVLNKFKQFLGSEYSITNMDEIATKFDVTIIKNEPTSSGVTDENKDESKPD